MIQRSADNDNSDDDDDDGDGEEQCPETIIDIKHTHVVVSHFTRYLTQQHQHGFRLEMMDAKHIFE